jgi:hypothetical protein
MRRSSPAFPKFRSIKFLFTKVGEHVPKRAIHLINGCVDCLATGEWLRSHGYRLPKRVNAYTDLFELVARDVGTFPVLYLEFGVYQGRTMRIWSRLLHNANSHLHGFDSFEGLPEPWITNCGVGAFNARGRPPTIDDPRVRFFKGWFEDTLPAYVPPQHECLVINVDCDLYSSTRTVLANLKTYIKPGTYIYFDEFNSREHELKAWDEFLTTSKMQFELLGADATLTHVLFRRRE